jgi:hypothetical protein
LGLEDRIGRLEQSLGDADVGPPPQAYYDARDRSARYMRALLSSGTGEGLDESERSFMEHYRDSSLKHSDAQLIERYSAPRSPEEVARAREKMKESLDAMADRRREIGI